jgi:hypothetical protein
LVAKVSNLLASLRPGYPSYLGAVEVLNLGTIPLPVFEYLAFNPLALHRSITYTSYRKLMFVSALCPVSAKVSSFSVWPVRTGPNSDFALHSNFPKQYAPTSAETKNEAAKNCAYLLNSYVTQRVANTPLHRATTLAATSNPK